MSESLLILLFVVAWLGFMAFWVWSLVDVLRVPDARWTDAGQNKVLWVVLVALLGALGSLLYVLMARPKLRARPA